jgi:hypothetical protein
MPLQLNDDVELSRIFSIQPVSCIDIRVTIVTKVGPTVGLWNPALETKGSCAGPPILVENFSEVRC